MSEYNTNWDNSPLPESAEIKTGKSKSYLFFIISIICFILMCAFMFFNYYFKKNNISSDNIIFNSTLSSGYESGVREGISFNIVNKNNVDLRNVELSIEYESGRKQNGEYNIIREKFNFGDLGLNQNVSTTTSLLFTGKEGDERNITYSVSYKLNNNTVFNKKIENKISISSSVIELSLDSNIKDDVINNDYVEVEADIKNISKNKWSSGKMEIQIPYGFVVTDDYGKVLPPNNFKNIPIPEINTGDIYKYKLSGYFDNKKIGENIFRFIISDSLNQNSLITESIININTVMSPFSYRIKYQKNGIDQDEIKTNSDYDLNIFIKNNSDYAYDDIYAKINISGSDFIFDLKSQEDFKRINPQEEKILSIPIFLYQKDSKMSIEIYAKKKNSTDKKLLLSEYYIIKVK